MDSGARKAEGGGVIVTRRDIDSLPQQLRDEFEERAAMREYMGGQARHLAEDEAYREVLAAATEARRRKAKPVESSAVDQLGLWGKR